MNLFLCLKNDVCELHVTLSLSKWITELKFITDKSQTKQYITIIAHNFTFSLGCLCMYDMCCQTMFSSIIRTDCIINLSVKRYVRPIVTVTLSTESLTMLAVKGFYARNEVLQSPIMY